MLQLDEIIIPVKHVLSTQRFTHHVLVTYTDGTTSTRAIMS